MSKPSQLEIIEKLEQLRALENNMEIKVVRVNENLIGVDTKDDLDRIRKIIKNSPKVN